MDEIEKYTNWDAIPDHLATKTQLSKRGLRRSRGQKPAGQKTGGYGPYDLYDVAEAAPKRKATEAQLAALAAARLKPYTCPVCGEVQPYIVKYECTDCMRYEGRQARGESYATCTGCGEANSDILNEKCGNCRVREAEEFAKHDKIETIETAQAWLERQPVFLDTETTGLDDEAEIVDIGIIDHDGAVLLNTLVRPTHSIPAEATNIHGISDSDMAGAPSFVDVLPEMDRILKNRTVLIYNAAYDMRFILQSAAAHDHKLEAWWWPPEDFDYKSKFDSGWHCAMELYATFYGDWHDWHGSYTWQKLGSAAQQCGIQLPDNLHRAAADAALTRLILQHMAESETK